MFLNIANLFDLLRELRLRPEMFLGHRSLERLDFLCNGYNLALLTHDINEAGLGFNNRFADYLHDRFGWSMVRGWAWEIRQHSASEEAAFERFFELLEDFKNQKILR